MEGFGSVAHPKYGNKQAYRVRQLAAAFPRLPTLLKSDFAKQSTLPDGKS
jgi:hypothetical protein